MRLAHIINPVAARPESDLFVAQPITFETMRRAKAYAARAVAVELLTAQFPEDRAILPGGFTPTPDLARSILDFSTFKRRRKLPLLRDILDRLYAASEAEYFIYTNVDIALLPNFYVTVARLIGRGCDSMVINRRTISKEFARLEEVPLMYAQVGEKHPGRDCFIWRRDAYPGFRLENICIGTAGAGKAILLSQLCTAKQWQEFRELHVTFHIGNDCPWKAPDQDDYRAFNLEELRKIVNYYREKNLLPENEALGFIDRRGI
jgi:hypothetical protein